MATKVCVCGAKECVYRDWGTSTCNLSKIALGNDGKCTSFIKKDMCENKSQSFPHYPSSDEEPASIIK